MFFKLYTGDWKTFNKKGWKYNFCAFQPKVLKLCLYFRSATMKGKVLAGGSQFSLAVILTYTLYTHEYTVILWEYVSFLFKFWQSKPLSLYRICFRTIDCLLRNQPISLPTKVATGFAVDSAISFAAWVGCIEHRWQRAKSWWPGQKPKHSSDYHRFCSSSLGFLWYPMCYPMIRPFVRRIWVLWWPGQAQTEWHEALRPTLRKLYSLALIVVSIVFIVVPRSFSSIF